VGTRRGLVARRRAFDSIAGDVWDALVDRSPAATPFSRHCVQRAWWDAYGDSAHDQTLVVFDESQPDTLVGIAPLMHRHELEAGDVAARTTLRHQVGPVLRPVPASATAVFFGASYHADYATILAAPDDLPAVCEAVVEALAAEDPSRWDVIDLRRLRAGDPASDALLAAFEWIAPRGCWFVTREQEDVCPVLRLPSGVDFEGYLDTLDKKERHEVRRKIRRAEAAGPVSLVKSADPFADLEAFIDLHQKRWGEDGLFPATAGGAASRRFFAELFESCAPTGIVELDFLTVRGRRIAAGVILDDGQTVYYYNAGVEPDARELSPGVVMVASYIKRALELGRTRLDFMRGNEPYKYQWGAVDEPIERLLVQRTVPAGGTDGSTATEGR
jgi:CelD/BcsL family acetyltransferase involved in cellulose biosynthesis